jgi:hypothetical protein
MASKFRRGAYAFTAKGQRYVVEEVSDGVVYCSADNGAEAEFAESSLLTEAEWTARSGGKAGLLYARLRQSRLFSAMPPKVDRAAAELALGKVERLMPGILDFTAYTIAERILAESGDEHQARELSIAKCREIFDAAKVEVRTGLLATVLGMQPDILAGAGRLGDNLMRALIAKGMEHHAAAFDEFSSRRRR